jgi:tetratricopeptide (TPR) repeat protein
MSKKKIEKNEPDGLQKVESTLGKSEAFIETHMKELTIIVVAIAVIISGVILFRYKYLAPREIKAQDELVEGQKYFATDSFRVALEGDGSYLGFEEIIKEYKWTKTANLAKAYAGISYFKLGDYENALKYLKEFDADDEIVSPTVSGLIGDCYVELGDVNKAITLFEKAAKDADNSLISPVFLKKAAIAYESQGNYDKAVENYTIIRDKYFDSSQAIDIERFIDRAKLKK